MGVVVVAHHLQLDERVALKFLHPEALRNPEAVARFAREARAMVRIKSAHVVRVRDVDALPNGAPYMVMEYLDGDDLRAVLQDAGILPIHEAGRFRPSGVRCRGRGARRRNRPPGSQASESL